LNSCRTTSKKAFAIPFDGLLQGTARELYARIRREQPDVNLIASGGVTDLSDLEALAKLNCFGAIVGKAIYEGRISLEELSTFSSTD
jgi:phosphoribosylformimino-5-aminoimidazole carboxamide ribotide isomerase